MSNGLKMAQNALFPYFSELFLVFLLKHPVEQYKLSQWVIVWNFQSKKFFFCRVGLPVVPETAQINPKLHFCFLNSILIAISFFETFL